MLRNGRAPKSVRNPTLAETFRTLARDLYVIIESLRIAFPDAVYYVADPLHSATPKHLSKPY